MFYISLPIITSYSAIRYTDDCSRSDKILYHQPHADDVNENYSDLRAYADINVALSRPIVNATMEVGGIPFLLI